jgi:hypothetical protein
MPAGTMLFLTRKLPYPLANVGNVVQIRTRQDYYQIEEVVNLRRALAEAHLSNGFGA